MNSQNKKIDVRICMGSSCFSRGNNLTLMTIQEYIARNSLEDRITLKGSLCEGKCKQGPNIVVDDVCYDQVDRSTVIDILEFHLKGDSGS